MTFQEACRAAARELENSRGKLLNSTEMAMIIHRHLKGVPSGGDPAMDKVILDNMVRLADHHRQYCEGERCNISVSFLLELLRRSGIQVPTNLIGRFM